MKAGLGTRLSPLEAAQALVDRHGDGAGRELAHILGWSLIDGDGDAVGHFTRVGIELDQLLNP